MSSCFPDYLSSESLKNILQDALDEDIGSGDITSETLLSDDDQGDAKIIMREDGVVAGIIVAQHIFKLVDQSIECQWVFADGDSLHANTDIGSISGPLRSILTAERVCLNVMQRMSGIATFTAQIVESIQGFPARIRDTRKTSPGLRLLDKWSVLIGGGTNHRIGLFDRILIKDNHIEVVGGLAASVQKASSKMPDCKIDVEAQTMADVNEALSVAHLIDVLLLDNMAVYQSNGSFDTSLLQKAVDRIDGKIHTEATGGITLDTAPLIAATGVDYLSCGALTHSVDAIDISLSVNPL
ncbi:MAG: carboxylating nicotinate-nucleotide diphosphorylase [Bacteroidetes bacterium]|nr:carboxylating nicotinate-nucleotide diphosphorylase [Bacteroidota bacterium]MCY4232611.1 carboxylating nicotinate-nucleotide diphosphorylase [Bacteroidota bacterium]